MLEPGQRLDLSFDLPDFEKIFTLSITSVISAILLSTSFIVGLMWAGEIFEDVADDNLDVGAGNYKEVLLYIGGLVFGAAALMFAWSTIFSIEQLYNLTIKGEATRIRLAVQTLYHACLVAGLALLFLVLALVAGEIEVFTDIAGVM